jgi:uncharacterized membrane protein
MSTPSHLVAAAAVALGLAACSPAPREEDGRITTDKAAPYAGIAPDEAITLTGTEPFWTIAIAHGSATYTTPENPAGSVFAVSRFAGNNGLGFTGELDGRAVAITVTPGQCSDAMSERAYPFTATIKLGEESLTGCGYTDRQGFTGAAAP